MADHTLVVQDIVRTGLDLRAAESTVVTADTYYMPNDGRTKLNVRNATGFACTVTIETPATVDGLAVADRTVSVADNKEFLIGPWPIDTYSNSSGNVKFTFNQTVAIVAVRG
jgi:hypothetical protein